MADDELRSLEKAAAGGDPGALLRFARALERLGRTDDAIDALLASEAPEIVSELRRHVRPFAFRRLDARTESVLQARPRVLWSASPGNANYARPSILGVACELADPRGRTTVLTLSGATRFALEGREVRMVEDVLLVWCDAGISGNDARTGAELWLLSGVRVRAISKDLVVFAKQSGAPTDLHVARLEDVRNPPRTIATLRVEAPAALLKVEIVGDRVLVDVGRRRVLTFTATGALVTEEDGALEFADEWGAVLRVPGRTVVLRSQEGDRSLPIRQGTWPVASTRQHILAGELGRSHALFDRKTCRLVLLLPDAPSSAYLLGERTFVFYDSPPWYEVANDPRPYDRRLESPPVFIHGNLVAVDLTGRELWHLPYPCGAPIAHLAACHGRVYATTEEGQVVCLAAP